MRSSHAFKRRQRSRYAVQDSARLEGDNDWQNALGLTDNDTGSSAEEEEETGLLKPVLATVGMQTEDAGLMALLAGTAGKDSLMAAARQEILRLKEVNSRLLQQTHPGKLGKWNCSMHRKWNHYAYQVEYVHAQKVESDIFMRCCQCINGPSLCLA